MLSKYIWAKNVFFWAAMLRGRETVIENDHVFSCRTSSNAHFVALVVVWKNKSFKRDLPSDCLMDFRFENVTNIVGWGKGWVGVRRHPSNTLVEAYSTEVSHTHTVLTNRYWPQTWRTTPVHYRFFFFFKATFERYFMSPVQLCGHYHHSSIRLEQCILEGTHCNVQT